MELELRLCFGSIQRDVPGSLSLKRETDKKKKKDISVNSWSLKLFSFLYHHITALHDKLLSPAWCQRVRDRSGAKDASRKTGRGEKFTTRLSAPGPVMKSSAED